MLALLGTTSCGDDFLKEEAEESAKAEVRTKGKTEDMKDPEAFFENELKKLSFED